MRPIGARLSSRRSQHLVFLAHVWACAPFLAFWMRDLHVRTILGPEAIRLLQPVIAATLVYLAVRTWFAWRDIGRISWQYVFSPIDVALITLILFLSHRGPMSNISLLFFLPMIQASSALNVRWAAAVGFMVVLGTIVSTFGAADSKLELVPRTAMALLQDDPLNSIFRIYFLVVLSSLMAYQALIAAGLKERVAVAADRNRIAMDMHDGVQGRLILLSTQLELISRIAAKDGARAAEMAQDGQETARQAADELRFLVQRMRSPSLSAGFDSALRQYAHNICERHGLELTFTVDGAERSLEVEVENTLFRIAQEALTNVVKHSHATVVTILVTHTPDCTTLRIQDDGVGFKDPKEGVGLANLKERAVRAGGIAEIKSLPGNGTAVEATFPGAQLAGRG